MKIALEFTYYTDIISVPDDIGKNIKNISLNLTNGCTIKTLITVTGLLKTARN